MLIVEIGAQKLALESRMPSLSSDQLIVTSESQTSLHEKEDDGKNRGQLKLGELFEKDITINVDDIYR